MEETDGGREMKLVWYFFSVLNFASAGFSFYRHGFNYRGLNMVTIGILLAVVAIVWDEKKGLYWR